MSRYTRPVQTLKEIRGIATVTASTVIAEIIDIRRFAREDNLASYSGLGMKEHSTGESTRMVATQSCNHRLKDAFMTAARNFLTFNPDSHLSGYYRNLVKNGMHPLEANKRVARALVRVIYRKLASLVEAENGRFYSESKSSSNGFWMGSRPPGTTSSPSWPRASRRVVSRLGKRSMQCRPTTGFNSFKDYAKHGPRQPHEPMGNLWTRDPALDNRGRSFYILWHDAG